MIVHCTSCRAKFRIADEKIGPRGAKARCVRCQAVFAVHRELGAMPLAGAAAQDAAERRGASRPSALDVDLESPERAAVPPPDPFEFPPSPERPRPLFDEADPFAAAPQQPASDADPFAWTLPTPGAREPLEADDPFQASPDPFASADPFGGAASESSGPDPFATDAAAGPDPFSADPAAGMDPFAADPAAGPDPFTADPAAGMDPFDADPAARPEPFPAPTSFAAAPDSFASAPTARGRGLPLTDLSDLLGVEPASSAPRPAPLAGPDLTLEDRATPRSVRAPGLARDLSLRDLDAPEPLFGGGPALALEREPAFALEREPAFALEREPAFAFGAPDLDLAAERSPSGRAPLALATDPSAVLPLGSEQTVAPAARPPPLPPAAPASSPFAAIAALDAGAAREAAPPLAAPPPRAPAAAASRARTRPRSRMASLVVNAVALAALLALALAIVVAWRGRRLEVAAFHPAAIVAALRDGAAAGPFATAGVRSGLYERERGAPLLFVRGEVVSRVPASVRAVRVAVEVVRDGTVVARGEALAGAVPTPEELWGVESADALERVARKAAARAPERIGPGDAVPFLVAFDDYPRELAGATLRVSAVPEERRP